MLRRRIVIEWDDEGTDTDEDCLKAFLDGEFTYQDLVGAECNPTIRVEDCITELVQGQFCKAIKAMVELVQERSYTYISHRNAAPFVADLPEFWREPARVMANCGYYASADEWMKENVEDGQ